MLDVPAWPPRLLPVPALSAAPPAPPPLLPPPPPPPAATITRELSEAIPSPLGRHWVRTSEAPRRAPRRARSNPPAQNAGGPRRRAGRKPGCGRAFASGNPPGGPTHLRLPGSRGGPPPCGRRPPLKGNSPGGEPALELGLDRELAP